MMIMTKIKLVWMADKFTFQINLIGVVEPPAVKLDIAICDAWTGNRVLPMKGGSVI